MVRQTELTKARRAVRANTRVRAASRLQVATVVGLDMEDTTRVLVAFDPAEEPCSVLAGPSKLRPGILAHVEMDAAGRPVRVAGPVTELPEGLDEGAEPPATFVPADSLAADEFSPEDQAKLDQAVVDLGVAQGKLAEAEQALEELDQSVLPELRDELAASKDRLDQARLELDTAFPSGVFDVAGAVGEAVTGTLIEYAVGTEAEAPVAGWTSSTPTRTPGSFIWMRTTVSYGDGSTSVLAPVLLTGNDGQPGTPGEPGAPGDPGDPGVGVVDTTISYAQSTSGTTAPSTGWQAEPPAPVAGRYVWTRTVWTYSDSSTKTGYSVGKIGEPGVKGDPGEPGAPGDPGDKGDPGEPGVGVVDTTISYAQSTSGTTAPSTGWQAEPPSPVAGRYVWTRTVWTYSDSSTKTGYSVGKIGEPGVKGDPGEPGAPGDKGDPGEPGAPGVSVTSVTPFYRQAASKPAKPTTLTPSGWSTTEPAFTAGLRLWRTERVVYSNNTFAYTDVSESSSYAVAIEAMTLANGKNHGTYRTVVAESGRIDNWNNTAWVLWRTLGYGSYELTLYTDAGPTPETWNFWIGAESFQVENQSTVQVNGYGAPAIEFETAASIMAWGIIEISYDGATLPGLGTPPPSGAGRAAGDIHRDRTTDRTIVAEWTWTGSAWESIHYGDKVFRSVDVGMLTATGASIADAVIQRLVVQLARLIEVDADKIVTGTLDAARIDTAELWADIATLGKIVTKELIANGAVTADALNVVFTDPSTGFGVSIQPEGLTLLDTDGAPMVTLRTDMANAFTVMKDGKAVASISPDGEVTGETVAANTSLRYRARELQDILDERAQGGIRFTKMTQAAIVGTSDARLVMATLDVPSTARAYKLTFGFHQQSASRIQVTFRQSGGTTVSAANSIQSYWYVPQTFQSTAQYIEIAHVIPNTLTAWGGNDQVTVGFFARSLVSGQTVTFDPNHGVTMLIEDIGPALDVIDSIPYVPSTGGGGGQGSDGGTTKTRRTKSWNSTSHRTYSTTSTTHVRAGQSVVQGAIAGTNNRGHWIFPDAQIRAELAGAENISGKLIIRNEHTYSSQGMTAVVRTHNYSSAPSTFGTAYAWKTVSVPRAQTVEIPLDSTVINQLKGNTRKGFSLDATTTSGGTGTAFYGYFSGTATIELTYTK